MSITAGTAAGQLLAILALPLLSRLYSPADVANYGRFVGVATVVTALAGLRLAAAIPIPDEPDSRRLFWLSAAVPAFTLPISLGTLWLAWSHLRPDSMPNLLGVGVFAWASIAFGAAAQLAVRTRNYTLLGRVPVVQTVGTLAAQIALGLLSVGSGLQAGATAGRCVGIVRLARGSRITGSDIPSRRQATGLLRRFWRFPVIFTPAAAANTLGQQLAAILLPGIVGLAAAGWYAMAIRIAAAPASILTQSLSQVFLGEFARAATRGAALRVFTRWSVMLAGVAVTLLGATLLLRPLIPVVLGSQWDLTAQLVSWTALTYATAILGSTLQGVWTVRQLGWAQMSWDLTRLAAVAATLVWAGVSGQGIVSIARALALVSCLAYAAAWLGCLLAVRATAPEPVPTGRGGGTQYGPHP